MPYALRRVVNLRLVLDTNVVLSAFLWRGTPHRLLQTIRQLENVTLFSSDILLAELARVLSRPGPAKRLAKFNVTARQILADYAQAVDFVSPDATPGVVSDDPDDDHVIAAAVAAGADFIASGDRHLLSLGTYRAIRIMRPAALLANIATAP
jgi:putative PIN family toxin of toxin-antitoxin system